MTPHNHVMEQHLKICCKQLLQSIEHFPCNQFLRFNLGEAETSEKLLGSMSIVKVKQLQIVKLERKN